MIKEIGRFGKGSVEEFGAQKAHLNGSERHDLERRCPQEGAERAGVRSSRLYIAQDRIVVKRNVLLVRYSFERLAKSFKRGELQRRWGEKVTIQRPGAQPMFGF